MTVPENRRRGLEARWDSCDVVPDLSQITVFYPPVDNHRAGREADQQMSLSTGKRQHQHDRFRRIVGKKCTVPGDVDHNPYASNSLQRSAIRAFKILSEKCGLAQLALITG